MSIFYGAGKFPFQFASSPTSSGGGGTTNPNISVVTRSASSSVTLTSSDLYSNEYFFNSTSSITVTLPALTSANNGAWILIKNAQSAGTLTVVNSGSTTLATMVPSQASTFVYDSSFTNNWVVF